MRYLRVLHLFVLPRELGLLTLLVLFGLQIGCSVPSSSSVTETGTKHSNIKPYILAVHPYNIPSKVKLHFAPILDYLTKTLQHPVTLYIATSYEDQIRKIATGEVDFAFLGPSSFVTALDKFVDEQGRRIQPIVTEQPYHAAVVVHKNSSVKNLADLKGKSMAFGSYFSYAGHFWAREAMRNEGVHLADLQIYSFMGRHERAVLSVAYGNFDAAATTAGIAERMQKLNYAIKIIETSKPLAPIVFVAAPSTSL